MITELTVISVKEISRGVFEAVFGCGEELPRALPGQFINIYPKNPSLTLPRPFAICEQCGKTLKIVFMETGKGTKEFSAYTAGEKVKVNLPLGNGFDLSSAVKYENHVLIGGSVGAAPLLMLAGALKSIGKEICVYIGFNTAPFLETEFKALGCRVYVSTEDGSYGEKGNVIDLLEKYDEHGEMYYACGPSPMLKAVCGYISKKGRNGQISVEERMACGFGACVGCAVKIKAGNGFKYLKACKDGPVFDYKEVLYS